MRVFLGMIFLVLLAYGLCFVLFVSSLPSAPDGLPKADGIVALTGGDERLDTAVALLEHGVGKRLLVSGVAQETTKETVGKMSEGGRRFACCADIGYAAEDTHGNAAGSRRMGARESFPSLVIVTAPLSHAAHHAGIFRRACPDVTLIAYPVDQSRIDLRGWWRHPRTVELLHREYVKYLASLVTMRLALMHDPGMTLALGACSCSGSSPSPPCCRWSSCRCWFCRAAPPSGWRGVWARATFWGLKVFAGIGLRDQRATLPHGPVLVASKHMSMWDTLALYLALDSIPPSCSSASCSAFPFMAGFCGRRPPSPSTAAPGASALRKMAAGARRSAGARAGRS